MTKNEGLSEEEIEFNILVSDIAARSFRDQADKDYIIAPKLYLLDFFLIFIGLVYKP